MLLLFRRKYLTLLFQLWRLDLDYSLVAFSVTRQVAADLLTSSGPSQTTYLQVLSDSLPLDSPLHSQCLSGSHHLIYSLSALTSGHPHLLLISSFPASSSSYYDPQLSPCGGVSSASAFGTSRYSRNPRQSHPHWTSPLVHSCLPFLSATLSGALLCALRCPCSQTRRLKL